MISMNACEVFRRQAVSNQIARQIQDFKKSGGRIHEVKPFVPAPRSLKARAAEADDGVFTVAKGRRQTLASIPLWMEREEIRQLMKMHGITAALIKFRSGIPRNYVAEVIAGDYNPSKARAEQIVMTARLLANEAEKKK